MCEEQRDGCNVEEEGHTDVREEQRDVCNEEEEEEEKLDERL